MMGQTLVYSKALHASTKPHVDGLNLVAKTEGKGVVCYLTLMAAVTLLSSLQSAVLAKWLSPASMGYFSIVTMTASYGVLLQFGLLSGLSQALPLSLGREDAGYAARLVGESMVVLTVIVTCAVSLFSWAVLRMHFADSNIRIALVLGGVLFFADLFFQFSILRLRCERRIIAFPLAMLVQKSVVLGGGIFATYLFDFVGPLLVWIGADIVLFFYTTRRHLMPADYGTVKYREIAYLMAIGLPPLIGGFLDNVRTSMDRVFLVNLTSPRELGIYYVGALPLSIGLVLNGVVNQYLNPRLMYEYGKSGCLRDVFRRSLVVSLVVGASLLVLWPMCTFVVNYAVGRWLPEYAESLSVFNIFYLGAVLAAGTPTIGVTFNAANRQALYLISSGLPAIFCLIAYAAMSAVTTDIRWYAYANVAGVLFNAALFGALAYYTVRRREAEVTVATTAVRGRI